MSDLRHTEAWLEEMKRELATAAGKGPNSNVKTARILQYAIRGLEEAIANDRSELPRRTISRQEALKKYDISPATLGRKPKLDLPGRPVYDEALLAGYPLRVERVATTHETGAPAATEDVPRELETPEQMLDRIRENRKRAA